MLDKSYIHQIIMDYSKKTHLYDGKDWYYKYIMDLFPLCDEICIYPLGNSAIELYNQVKNKLNVCYMSDGDSQKVQEYKEKGLFGGIEILDIDALYKKRKHVLILVASIYHGSICTELEQRGFTNVYRIMERQLEFQAHLKKMNLDSVEKRLGQVLELVEDSSSMQVIESICKYWFLCEEKSNYWDSIYDANQYFPEGVIKLNDDEVFCDIGAFTGDSFEMFIEKINADRKDFRAAHLIELSRENYNLLQKSLLTYSQEIQNKVRCWNVGISDRNSIVGYIECDSTTKICESNKNEDEAEIVTLDRICDEICPTYIKMDIEGEEYAALKGARNTVDKYNPKLGICIYHCIEDVWRIPFLIKEYSKDYKLFLRHHSGSAIETVCYAVK